MVNVWPVGGTNCLGSSQILQRFKSCRFSTSNWVPHAAQIRRLSVLDIMPAGGWDVNS